MKNSKVFVVSAARWLFVAVLAGVGVGNGLVASGQEEDDKAPTAPQINLRTVYLSDPIGNAHQITITGQLGGAGQITLDGNTCVTSSFGDTTVCTKVLFPPTDIKLVQLRLADPSGRGRRLFLLQGELAPVGAKYHLVVPRRRSEPHRLVVDLGNDRRRVVTLERPLGAPRPKPELCREAEYRAEQADGKVTIFAQGEHPTAAWKVAFEQLPIRIFPPQFRLVCFPPSGLAAQVITPFTTQTSFDADQPVKVVIVHDERGQHRVPVAQKRAP